MTIIAKKKQKKQYPQASDALHPALLIDVTDLGEQNGPWGPKHKIKLTYVVDELDSDGKPILVSDFPALSLDPKSRLYGIIKALAGVVPEEDTDVEALIGKQCQLLTEQYEGADGFVYANVKQTMPQNPRDPVMHVPADFVRAKDRDNGKSKANGKAMTAKKLKPPLVDNVHGLEISDQDAPF